ncbi:sigma-70 family RNA polymerase sigma factor [Aestuariibacter sp. AA17]|uniref:Sigma-70 family RNA polymerase sigma factor n=1 Tax=Fluctibacter corallii TaxID=2984329 RepID=A0ABT3AB22_9ALTE|nr:sigma-70 family RNA polymerase sigma factor [Aestuariibacter sp. AA17]MCV2885866.1 sigma-70 family RNA polymerase sigma factor [Aestuariibacter sp. AA17]
MLDQQQKQQILQEYAPILSRVATSYEANAAMAQELSQEMCLAVWQSLSKFKGNSSVKTYIYRVAHNKGVSHVAYHANRPKHADMSEHSMDIACSTNVETTVSSNQQIQELLTAVRNLSMSSRQVLTMSMEGLSYQEIGEVMGMNTNQVGVILNRAKKQVKKVLNYE